MFSIEKTWKEYWVYLPHLHAWLQSNAGEFYCGISADVNLRIHFTEQPSAEIESAVNAYWDGLTSEGEAAKWDHYDDLSAAEADARVAILTANWNDMIAAERKIAMNQALTSDDKEALLVKYPRS